MSRILLSFSFLFLCGCSSLLYWPVKEDLIDRTRLPVQPRDVWFASEDGAKLHGWYFSAKKQPPRGVVLFFHGNAQNITTHFGFLYFLLDHGYDYFIFDYQGYGRSSGEPSPEKTVRDGRGALRWLAANKPASAPIVIFGQSLGGAVALRVAGEMRDEVPYEKVIVDSTFHSYRKAAQRVLSRHWLTWAFQWLPWLVLSDKWGPRDFIGKISPRPLIVIHGTEDVTVGYDLGEKVFEMAGEPKEFWPVRGGRHTDFLYRENFAFRRQFLDWLERGGERKETEGRR